VPVSAIDDVPPFTVPSTAAACCASACSRSRTTRSFPTIVRRWTISSRSRRLAAGQQTRRPLRIDGCPPPERSARVGTRGGAGDKETPQSPPALRPSSTAFYPARFRAKSIAMACRVSRAE